MSDRYDAMADAMAKLYISRPDVKAVQHPNGIYTPDRHPFTRADLRAHLQGDRTYGHYMLSKDDTTKLFVFDIDLTKQGHFKDKHGKSREFNPRRAWVQEDHPAVEDLTIQLRTVAEALALRAQELTGCTAAVSYSGSKGMHVYCYTGIIPAEEAREMSWLVLDSFEDQWERKRGKHFWRHATGYPNIELETFPKQTTLAGKDLGNLMRLPLGIHQNTKQPAYFVDLETGYNVLQPASDQLEALQGGNVRV